MQTFQNFLCAIVADQEDGLVRLHDDFYQRERLFGTSEQLIVSEVNHICLDDLISHFNQLVEGLCERELLNGPSVAFAWCGLLEGVVVSHNDQTWISSADLFGHKANSAFGVGLAQLDEHDELILLKIEYLPTLISVRHVCHHKLIARSLMAHQRIVDG